MYCFICLEICTFPSPGWCPSTDLGGLEALLWWWDLSADPARQVARDITPLALACSGRVFFQSLQIGEGRFIKVLLLPYQLLRVSASQTEHLFSWVSMKRLLLDPKVQAWRLLSLTPSVFKCTTGRDLGSDLPQVHHLNHWLDRLVWTCHHDEIGPCVEINKVILACCDFSSALLH